MLRSFAVQNVTSANESLCCNLHCNWPLNVHLGVLHRLFSRRIVVIGSNTPVGNQTPSLTSAVDVKKAILMTAKMERRGTPRLKSVLRKDIPGGINWVS